MSTPFPAAHSGHPPLHRVERLAKILDEAFRIPGTRIRVGLDAVIGLIPVVGDVIGLGLGSWFIYEAHRLGAPTELKLKMARNVAIDAVAGLVPVFGDLVDVAFRSNRRNLALLRAHFTPVDAVPETSRIKRAVLTVAFLLGVVALGYWLLHR